MAMAPAKIKYFGSEMTWTYTSDIGTYSILHLIGSSPAMEWPNKKKGIIFLALRVSRKCNYHLFISLTEDRKTIITADGITNNLSKILMPDLISEYPDMDLTSLYSHHQETVTSKHIMKSENLKEMLSNKALQLT